MSGWILVEDMDEYGIENVEVINVANVMEFYADEDYENHTTTIKVKVRGQRGTSFWLKDWEEFRKFLLQLPGAQESNRFLHIKNGQVLGAWRGSLEVLEKPEKSEDVKELSEEEENEVLKEGGE